MDLNQWYGSWRLEVHYQPVWKWFACSLGFLIFICMCFCPAAERSARGNTAAGPHSVSFLRNGWAGSWDRLMLLEYCGLVKPVIVATTALPFQTPDSMSFFWFLFHSQRTDSKHTHFLPAIFKPFLASPWKNVWAGIPALPEKKNPKKQQCREYKRFHFLFNLYWAEKSSLKMVSLGRRESLPGGLCQQRPCHVTHLQTV